MWPLTFSPVTVNAVYIYSRNQILSPVGIIQPPFFAEDQPMALNFGHLGAFIGHEVPTSKFNCCSLQKLGTCLIRLVQFTVMENNFRLFLWSIILEDNFEAFMLTSSNSRQSNILHANYFS